jgi:dihydroorotate dehydrogenase (NAD+) catalytic subunit
MSVAFCGLELAHPIINGSGTFDALAARKAFGAALDRQFPFAAYVSKTITLEPRAGNPPPRLWEAPAGLINSIGLPNKGLAGYLNEDLPALASLPVPLITNVMGSTEAEISELMEACDAQRQIAAIELNVSCPNVKTGLDIGADPRQLEQVVRAVRPRTSKPLIVKLTPNAADVPACALAAEAGGADAVSLINTLRAMALVPGSPRGRSTVASSPPTPWLGGGSGGLSGPAIRAVALTQVAAVTKRVGIPAIGMGGVSSGAHARDLLDVGARLVAVGTESFRDPAAAARIARELDPHPAALSPEPA